MEVKISKKIPLITLFSMVLLLFALTQPAAALSFAFGEFPVLEQEHAPTVTVRTAPVLNLNPEAKFAYVPDRPGVGELIQFVDSSSDPDGQVTVWLWDFGDGTTSMEKEPLHVYMRVGTYSVTLTVTDNVGAQASLQKEITVKRSNSDILLMIAAVIVMIIGLVEAYLLGRKRKVKADPSE